MIKLFKILFSKENDEYKKTREEFREISKKVKNYKHQLIVEMEGLTTQEKLYESNVSDINFIKNEWVKLPEAIGNGVLSMGVEENEKRKAFLVHYEPNSEIFTHTHPNNIERIQVLTGYIVDNTNNVKTDEGSTYLVDKNTPHNIVTLDTEAYLFIVFSEEMDSLTVKNLIK